MRISPFRTLLLFGVVKTQLTPKEHALYMSVKRAGKHNLGSMSRQYVTGAPYKTRVKLWRAQQNALQRRAHAIKL